MSLNAERYTGTNLQSFVVTDPAVLALYPNIPSISTLLASTTATQNTYRLADDIRAPYNMQTNIGVDRQLPFKFTFSANYINTRGFNQLRIRNVNAPVNYVFGTANSGTRPFGNVGNVFQYESGGKLEQNQLQLSVRNNFSGKFSIFGMYILGKATSDTDGASYLPANSYDLSGEMGRSSLDVRQRLILGGTINAPLGFSVNPFVIVSSGQPFNITTGLDTNGDSAFTERPTYAQVSARCNTLRLTDSFCDIGTVSDVNQTIPRNYGIGPNFATFNVRFSKTFGFGGESSGGFPGGAPSGGPGNGPPPGAFGGAAKRFNLTFSLQAQNLFNNTNAGTPIGNLRSTLFGQSNSLAGSFGFGPSGVTTSSAAYNRRLEGQVRFSF